MRSRLPALTALIAVPINTAFGIAAAWAITKFDFPGRRFLLVVIEIPFSISPIVAGVAYLLAMPAFFAVLLPLQPSAAPSPAPAATPA